LPKRSCPEWPKESPQVIARQRPLVIGIALLLGALGALGGCATGQITQTASQAAAVNGASGQAGSIAVRDAEVAYPENDKHFYPAGSSAPLKMTIVNTSGTEDRLVAVQSPLAASVRLEGTTTIPGRSAIRVVPHADQAQASTTTATTTTPAPASPPTFPTVPPVPTASPSLPGSTSVPATEGKLAPGELTITLENLTEALNPGKPVRVVLVFEQAGEVALAMPIAAPDEPRGESAH
jgi:copper(I)-binding protein